MSLSTNSGTGLKPVASPTGLKLTSSPFTAQPDEEVVPIDVYTAKGSSVINSIQEDTGESEGFFDKIKNAVSSTVGNLAGGLGGGLNLSGMAGGGLGALKTGTSLLRQVTNVASRAMSAVNQIQRGGVMGTIGGLSSLGGMSGLTGAMGAATSARGLVSGISQGGVAGYLRAGSSLLGNQGYALNQLASNVGSITRAGNLIRNAGSGNLSSILGTVDYSLNAATSTLGSLDRASQINFQNGFNSVVGKSTNFSAQTYNTSVVGRVTGALSDYTSGFVPDQPFNVATRAGTVTGLALTGAAAGANNIYSLARSQGLDDKSAQLAGTALTSYAARSGNISMLTDLSSDPVGAKSMASNPKALSMAVSLMAPPTHGAAQKAKSYTDVYNEIEGVKNKTGQEWNKSERGMGQSIFSVMATGQSDYARAVVQGKAASDDLASRKNQSAINSSAATASDAQIMTASMAVMTA